MTRGAPRVDDDRHLISSALDTTLVVEAAAGTGKTTELVKRVVRLIETGRATIEQVVAVTFSESGFDNPSNPPTCASLSSITARRCVS